MCRAAKEVEYLMNWMYVLIVTRVALLAVILTQIYALAVHQIKYLKIPAAYWLAIVISIYNIQGWIKESVTIAINHANNVLGGK